MGTFRVEVVAVGGHGCQRDQKDGETVTGCGHVEHCPDCAAREFVARLKKMGCSFGGGYTDERNNGRATLQHWPFTTTEVQDDLLTGTRKGSF